MKKLQLLYIFGTIISSLSFAQTRIVLVEQFTNSSCPPCATFSPTVYNFANNNPSLATVIAYHTVFPYNNDSMYHANTVDPTQRASYYSVSGTPTSVMDGNQFKGATGTFNTNISNSINNRALIAPKYTIQQSSLILANNQLSGTFQFTSINAANANDNLIAHIVIIEKDVLKSSYAASPGNNSESHYEYVMRKMIPNATGTVLINKTLNGTDIIPLSWTLSNIKNINEIRVVAFVQNNTTKEIYQSILFTPQISATGITEEIGATNINIYPNPMQNELSIAFEKVQFVDNITIVDQLGKIVYTKTIKEATKQVPLQLDLSSGIYYLKIAGAAINQIQKISIIK